MPHTVLPSLGALVFGSARGLVLLLILGFATVTPRSALFANDILDLLPSDALGFVVVNDLTGTDQKIDRLATQFESPLPSLLTFANVAMNLERGLDLSGSLLFAMLPGENASAVPAPMFLLPVADYDQFAASIAGDTSGEICRITLAGENLLVAKHGNFALIMNPEHRQRMEAMLAAESPANSQLPGVKPWVKGNDVTAALLPRGLSFVTQLVESSWEADIAELEEQLGESNLSREFKELHQFLQLMQLAKANVEVLAVGLAVDSPGNVKARWRTDFSPQARMTADTTPQSPMLTNLPAKPFATAGSGALRAHWHERLADFFIALTRQSPEDDGYEEFTDADWQDLREYYRLNLVGIREFSFIVTPGGDEAPLLSNIFALLKTERAADYFEQLKSAVPLINSITERSTSDIKIEYATEPMTIAGASGYMLTANVAEATGDEHVDIWQNLLTEFLGKDGVLRMYFCAIDEERIAFGMQSEEKFAQFVEECRRGESSLANDEQVKPTLTLVERDSCFVQLIYPQEVIEVIDAAMHSINPFGPFGVPPQKPEYPAAPPVGVTVAVRPQNWSGEVVLPSDTLQALAAYLRAKQRLNE